MAGDAGLVRPFGFNFSKISRVSNRSIDQQRVPFGIAADLI